MLAKITCLLAFVLFGISFAMGMTQHPQAFSIMVISWALGSMGAMMWPETDTMRRCRIKRQEEMQAHIAALPAITPNNNKKES